MSDTTVKKIDAKYSPKGAEGQKYLASGKNLAMRLWENEAPGQEKPSVKRPYESVGFVLKGKAELKAEGQTVLLEKGDSYLVPKDSDHSYKILETFSAVEATSPPAQVHSRK